MPLAFRSKFASVNKRVHIACKI